jgi:DNA-binding MarR family transcriptional regulator
LQRCGDNGLDDLASDRAIEEFLGSAYIFAVALGNVLEADILREVVGAQLTSAQIRVLKLIARGQTRSVGDVAKLLGVSNPAASQTVDRLVRRKLVRRTERETDRRANELELTAAASRILAEYEDERGRRLEQVFREVPLEDLRKTALLLDQVAASIVTHSVNPEEVCLHCEVYLQERCPLREVSNRTCSRWAWPVSEKADDAHRKDDEVSEGSRS